MTKAEIDSLRSEIERIDEQIVELVAQRQQIAGEIGLVKARDGIEVRDREREERVRAAFARRAAKTGLDPGLSEALAELLIQHSVKLQLQYPRKDLAGLRVLVVGGAGKTGAWFCRRFANRGAEVVIWDSRGTLDGYENVAGPRHAGECDITVVASPPGMCPSDITTIIDEGPRGLIFDVCSVKTHIAGRLRSAASSGARITSVHPMFGPSSATAMGRNVIVCSCGCPQADDEAEGIFRAEGANVVRMSIEQHDEAMAFVLNLPHLCGLLFGAVLTHSGKELGMLEAVQGPSFRKLAAIARELSRESTRVYHDIEALNPRTRELVKAMSDALDMLGEAATRPDPAEFRRIMESNRRYFQAV